jgi:hypothetical protein
MPPMPVVSVLIPDLQGVELARIMQPKRSEHSEYSLVGGIAW